jgi:hypothetical protein
MAKRANTGSNSEDVPGGGRKKILIQDAKGSNRDSNTLEHKGNVMK